MTKVVRRRAPHVQRILALDTETTGVDPEKDVLIEVACVLWDVQYRTRLAQFSTLIGAQSNAAAHINHIPEGALRAIDDLVVEQLSGVPLRMLLDADCIVAHNAAFDRQFWLINDVPWVCSMEDIAWPAPHKRNDLVSIALAHGVPVYTAHRAMADADLIVRLLERCAELGHDVQDMLDNGLRRSKLPKFHYVSLEPFERKDEVKAAGFRWDTDKKEWWRDMNEEDAAKVEGIRMRKANGC